MPFKSLDDLQYLIKDRLQRHAQEVMVKASAMLPEYTGRKQRDRELALAGFYTGEIGLATADLLYWSDMDCGEQKEEVRLPRFMLRH
jgi:hypothetical protein